MPGSPGQQGPQGHQGYAGTQGDQGNQGLQGSQGGPGVQGNQGFQGAQGFQGHQGHQGFQGTPGTQGPQGFQGAQGLGVQGPQGYQGHQGGPGPQGPQGAQGYPALLNDGAVSYAKLASDLVSRNTVSASDIDWNAGGVFTKTITGATTFTFSNLKLNKVITLVLTGNYTLNLPSYCKKIYGNYKGAVSNYIQFHCTNETGASEEVWYTISQQAT